VRSSATPATRAGSPGGAGTVAPVNKKRACAERSRTYRYRDSNRGRAQGKQPAISADSLILQGKRRMRLTG
jgi:hypothetical protein